MAEYNLERFVGAQEKSVDGYETALRQIKNGKKTSHWIWYIFPQIQGLGKSYPSQLYGIRNLEEAREYLKVPSLRANLLEISNALLEHETSDARVIMGPPDDKKLRSSMTLFAEAEPECEVFRKVLDKFFGGRKDGATLKILNR